MQCSCQLNGACSKMKKKKKISEFEQIRGQTGCNRKKSKKDPINKILIVLLLTYDTFKNTWV